MALEVDKKRLRTTGIAFGAVLGVALTVFSIVSYYIILSATSVVLISSTPFIFSVLLPIVLVVVLCLNFRKRVGGWWTMREAATGIFIMFFTAFVIQFALRDQLFAKVIEPRMAEKTQAAMTASVSKFLTEKKTSPDIIKKKLDEIHQEFEAQKDVTLGRQIVSLGFSIIFMFVLAIIFAAFFKREAQVYNPQA
jgi:amino acid transporter